MTSSVSPTHPSSPGNVVPLLNSVIDVCLVYGVDETSSREIPVTEEGVRGGGGGSEKGRGEKGRGERGRGWEGEGEGESEKEGGGVEGEGVRGGKRKGITT